MATASIETNLGARDWRAPATVGSLVIGLVNNMPDAALYSTERQFRELLESAAGPLVVSLRLFALPELPRTTVGAAHIKEHYEDISALWSNPPDGLIVTGTEPHAPALPDEPYWRAFTKLVDWAGENAISVVWSCLAAHAAVRHLDGIDRRRLSAKLSGVFECIKGEDHPLLSGIPSRWRIPHSRYNDLPEEALVSKDYRILARSCEAGVDTFIRENKSLFIFFQGHPEYDRAALFREYRRDIIRFLAGECDGYPEMPSYYFDPTVAATFFAFRQQALSHRSAELLAKLQEMATEAKLSHDWFSPAVSLYANWLKYLANHKTLNRSRPA